MQPGAERGRPWLRTGFDAPVSSPSCLNLQYRSCFFPYLTLELGRKGPLLVPFAVFQDHSWKHIPLKLKRSKTCLAVGGDWCSRVPSQSAEHPELIQERSSCVPVGFVEERKIEQL